MVGFKLNISSALDREERSVVLIGSSCTAAASKKHMEHFFQCLRIKIFAWLPKISEDFQLTRESTDHHNSELETGRVKGTLCWEGGRAGQLVLVLELLTHRVSVRATHACQGWVW